MSIPFLGDSYQMAASGVEKKRLWAELDFQPGEHALTILLPPTPAKCFVDGVLTPVEYDRPMRATRLKVTTPPVPYQPVAINQVETWTERFALDLGEWLAGPLRALEELGAVPYGYVKYRGEFQYHGEPKMFISARADDGKKVFVNGKLVPEASTNKPQVELALGKYARSGSNTIEISYELFGAPNFGSELGELKGIESVRLGSEDKSATAIEGWKIQRFPPAMLGREIDPRFPAKGWSAVTLGEAPPSPEIVPAFAWCRAEFATPTSAPNWSVAWKLKFEADRDALLYLNGKFVGRYVMAGPQKEFYLPEPYFATGGKARNTLNIVLAYTDQPHHIHTLQIAPYEEFAARRTRLEFEW